jgi:ribose 5-phosphate isomerase B
MKIFIGSDHGGFIMKEALKAYLQDKFDIEDCGCFNEDSVDYPDIAQSTCHKVLKEEGSLGILVCGTGIGISIAANKVSGARAALCNNEYMAQMSRNHNNANILCLGGRVIGEELAKSIVDTFLSSKFEGGRHERRVGKMECII